MNLLMELLRISTEHFKTIIAIATELAIKNRQLHGHLSIKIRHSSKSESWDRHGAVSPLMA